MGVDKHNQSKALKQNLRFPGGKKNSQDCNIEILPEFPACQPILRISDLPLASPHKAICQFLNINLPKDR